MSQSIASQNIFKPLATPAESEYDIALFVLAITAAIFIVVGGLIVFTIVRFRRRPEDDSRQEPPQVYGSNQIEVAWTVIPILIVFVLIGVSARVIAGVQNASPPPSDSESHGDRTPMVVGGSVPGLRNRHGK